MENESALLKIDEALAEIERQSPNQSDGKWLEKLSAECALLISDWQVQKVIAGTSGPMKSALNHYVEFLNAELT